MDDTDIDHITELVMRLCRAGEGDDGLSARVALVLHHGDPPRRARYTTRVDDVSAYLATLGVPYHVRASPRVPCYLVTIGHPGLFHRLVDAVARTLPLAASCAALQWHVATTTRRNPRARMHRRIEP